MSPFIIPLAVFAMVVLIVAIVNVMKIREKELDVHHNLHIAEMQHQQKMKELEAEHLRIQQGN